MKEKLIQVKKSYSSKLEKIKALKEEYMKEIKGCGTEIVKEAAKPFFEDYPSINSFTVYAYTPWFNDGDACEYSVYFGEFKKINGKTEDFDSIGAKWSYGEDAGKFFFKEKDLQKKTESFHVIQDLFSDRDLVYHIFGDHMQIVISRDGENVSVDAQEFDHD